MSRKAFFRNLYASGIPAIRSVDREMRSTKFYAILLVSVMFIGIFSLSPALSSLTSSVSITTSGKIAPTPTITATSGYWQDIQTAVNWIVANGGIGDVYIPEGTWNFVNVGETWIGVEAGRVVVPAGVNIYGAPTERDADGQVRAWKTILVMPWDVPGAGNYNGISWFKFVGAEVEGVTSRLSDIKLVGYRSIDPNSTTVHAAIRVQGICDFRIDHCYFEHTCLGIQVWGLKTHGVIDHCFLINPVAKVGATLGECTVIYGVCMGRGYGDYWDDNTENVLGHYTDYTTFIEDCYFEKWRHCIAANNGAHYVFRHNTIKDDFGFGSLDAHGWGAWDGEKVTQVGTRAVEIYENQIIDAIQNSHATFIRGGAGIAFNNTVGGGTYCSFLSFSDEADPNVSKCFSHDWWIWNNTMLLSGPDAYHPNTPCELVVNPNTEGNMENVDYFLHAPDTFVYTPYPYPHPLTLEATP